MSSPSIPNCSRCNDKKYFVDSGGYVECPDCLDPATKESKGMYCGVPIEDLTREELEDALIVVSNLYSDSLERARGILEL